jgi:photosystem II stability/assembly factor-like uncharacterized protein
MSLLLDAVHTDAGYFVSGERGHVLNLVRRQQVGPAEGAHALDAHRAGHRRLPAVGRQATTAVILHSADGGQTWHPQRRDPYALAEGQDPADRDQRQGAPLLDILFTDATHGIAVGAYSLMLQTSDGGGTWTAVQALASDTGAAAEPEAVASESGVFDAADLELGEESNPHFNAIARTGSGALAVVGERGTFLRSRDDGATWQKVAFPYAGSLFGVLAWEDDHILAYGLRGNVYESTDLGSTWTKVDSAIGSNLMGGTALANGGAALVGSNGAVLVRPDGASPFVLGTYTQRRRRDAGAGRRDPRGRRRLRGGRREGRGHLPAEEVTEYA